MRLARLFGKRPFSELKSEADQLFERGQYGQAKLAYERAAEARDMPQEERDVVGERVGACCDAIATSRIREAERLLESGDRSLAEDELQHALETAWSAPLRQDIATLLEQLQRQEVRQQVASFDHVSDEDRYLAISGSWEDDQVMEYQAYGEQFRRAVLQFHEGQVAVATREFEAVMAEAEDPVYLWFEVGRARLENGDRVRAQEALSTFLARLAPGEGGDARLTAHMALAHIAMQRDDFDAAMQQYSEAVEALPDDPRPYLAMATFMRHHELAEEALDVLSSVLAILPEDQPNFRIWHELGLCHADVGQSAEAIDWLEQVVSYFTTRQHFDLPPEGTLRLAQLHESSGNVARAADLLRLLCQGSDRINLFAYHLEATRLLCELSAKEDAQRMLSRAMELVPSEEDEQTKAALDAAQARVDALQ